MRDIGKNIRDLRESKKLTQEEMAERLYVTRQTVSNYETGKTRPDIDMIMKIAETLNVDANTVFYGLPLSYDKKAGIKRQIISSAILVVMMAAAIAIHPYNEYLFTRRFDVRLNLFLVEVYFVFFMLLLGWSLMNAVGLIFKLKPIDKPWARIVKITLLAVLTAYFAVVLSMIAMMFDIGGVSISNAYYDIYLFAEGLAFNYNGIFAVIGGVWWICRVPIKRSASIDKTD